MRSARLTLLGILLLAGTAAAGAMAAEEPHFQGALDLRIETLEGIADPTDAEATELARLRKARKKLRKYRGKDDDRDMGRIVKVVRQIERSETADAFLEASLLRIRRIFDSFATGPMNAGVLIFPLMVGDDAMKVRKRLNQGDARRREALDIWDTSPGESLALLLEAHRKYTKAVRKGRKYRTTELDSGDVRFEGNRLFNHTDHTITVTDLRLLRTGIVGGEIYGYSVMASTYVGDYLAVDIPGGGNHDFQDLLRELYESDTLQPEWVDGDYTSGGTSVHLSGGDVWPLP